MNSNRVCFIGLLVASFAAALNAGERGPGKYSGTVLFDRWDACSIYSGISVMYVSKKVKEKLRPLAGQRVSIDAKDVFQPRNPGDGLIKELEVIWPTPKNSRAWVKLSGLRLTNEVNQSEDGRPLVKISLWNDSDEPIEILSNEWTPTLFTRGETNKWAPFDDASAAFVTRMSFRVGEDESRWKDTHWTIGKENALPDRFILEPHSEKTVSMQFELPDGEYDFICGYGWHQGFASRPIGFDVRDGKLISNTTRSNKIPDLGAIDLGRPIAPVRAQWVWQRPIHDHTGRERPLALRIRNNTGHQIEIDYDPKKLTTDLYDKESAKIEMGAEIRSGPIPQSRAVSLAPGCEIDIPTHRGGIGIPNKKTLFIAGWNSWQLETGTYTARGKVSLSVRFGKSVDPLLPNRQTKPEWFGEEGDVKTELDIELPEVKFDL